MIEDLYERLVEALNILAEDCEGSEPLSAMHSALRGVVERHKPEPCVYFSCKSPGTHVTCSACGGAVNHPCDEIKDIAERLGITDPTARA